MSDEIRKEIISKVKKIVIKIGTAVLTDKTGFLDRNQIAELSRQAVGLRIMGYDVAIVSSGAIGAGIGELGLKVRPKTLPELQAAAAVGQGKLIAAYDECFKKHGYHAGQILLTREDFEDRKRYLNASNTIHSLFNLKIIPVVNENDTISTDEIAFGDNDTLSALVTNLIRADVLIILSSVDGLRTEPPSAGKRSKIVPIVESVTDEIKKLAFSNKTERGVGGMETKLQAAAIATNSGEAVVIANGREHDVLLKIMQGNTIGTLFLPAKQKLTSRKRWIGFSVRPKGRIFVDKGATEALTKKGKSLLASGITALEGNFEKGDVVSILGQGSVEFARGQINYSSNEVKRIAGLNTQTISKTLGSKPYDEVIHRDNMVLTRQVI
ncbi:MAG: glutamate 5-kinase [Candidatus Brocadiales bacterium]